MNVFERIGYNGDIINFFITSFSLWKQPSYASIFVLCYFIDIGINKILKKIIREPRPPGYADVSETLQSKYVNEEKFGMPSGHSESLFFSTAFLWFVIGSPIMLMIELFICAITLYQRWKNKKHTVEQLFVGAWIGILFAYFVFWYNQIMYKNTI